MRSVKIQFQNLLHPQRLPVVRYFNFSPIYRFGQKLSLLMSLLGIDDTILISTVTLKIGINIYQGHWRWFFSNALLLATNSY